MPGTSSLCPPPPPPSLMIHRPSSYHSTPSSFPSFIFLYPHHHSPLLLLSRVNFLCFTRCLLSNGLSCCRRARHERRCFFLFKRTQLKLFRADDIASGLARPWCSIRDARWLVPFTRVCAASSRGLSYCRGVYMRTPLPRLQRGSQRRGPRARAFHTLRDRRPRICGDAQLFLHLERRRRLTQNMRSCYEYYVSLAS